MNKETLDKIETDVKWLLLRDYPYCKDAKFDIYFSSQGLIINPINDISKIMVMNY
jgi:hypothetical protein